LLRDEEIEIEQQTIQKTVRSMAEYAEFLQQKNEDAIELAWKDISVFSGTGGRLLSDASGVVKSKFMAIMGPSGSGKTTLMNVLACRLGGAKTQGTATINGVTYSGSELKQVSGYVMQDDLLNGHLTVEETLYYTAELRLPSSFSREEKQERIEEVMERLGLTRCRNTIVGDPLKRGVSGGERKRLCVAIELLTRPKLLFLDEPTSGLDSVTALSLCTTLKQLATSGQCTVITTIHQPQNKIFQQFDDLILLKSGRIVYYGPAAEVMDFFAEAGFPCPPMTNPADHMLDVITLPSYKSAEQIVDVAPEEKLISMRKPTNVNLEESRQKYGGRLAINERPPWIHQLRILFQRSVKEQVRAKDVLLTQLIQNIIMALLIGLVFFPNWRHTVERCASWACPLLLRRQSRHIWSTHHHKLVALRTNIGVTRKSCRNIPCLCILYCQKHGGDHSPSDFTYCL
jgi:ATP-binding cassette subfamily G (WHITE) protein 2